MAESPIPRPYSRASSHGSCSTRYELDIDALLNENDDDSAFMDSIAPPNNAIDMIFSEDIDGPTDFTQNMEFWLNGGHVRPKKQKMESQRQRIVISEHRDVVQDQGDLNAQDKINVGNITQTTAFAGQLGRANDAAPLSSPRANQKATKQSDAVELNGREFAMESKSAEESTHFAQPKSGQQRQPESHDDLPARPRPRSASPSALGDTLRRSIALKLTHANAQEGDRSQNVYSRDEQAEAALQRLHQELSQSKSETELVKAENASLRSKLQEQELKNEGLRQTLNYQISTASRKSDDRVQSLNRQMDQLRSQHQRDLEHQRGSYEARIASYDFLLSANKSQPGITTPESQMPAAIDARSQLQTLESQLSAANATIASLRSDLSHSQEAVRVLRLEATDSRRNAMLLNHQSQQSQMHTANQTSALQAQIAELKEQLRATEIERDLAETAREDLEEQAEALESRMEDMSGARGAAAAEAKLHDEKAVLQQKVDELEDQIVDAEERINELERENGALEEERDRAWKEAKGSEQTSKELASERARKTAKEIEALRHEIASYETVLRQREDQAEAAREQSRLANGEIATLRAEFTAVNTAMDRKVKEVIDARDLEWTKKIQLLDKDRQIMGKVLLREWGRAELGKTAPQVYRYKYAMR